MDQHADFNVVDTAGDGREALEHCDPSQPDIVQWIFVCREWMGLKLYLR
ncbi:chemotaxis protein CheY [Paenibacillus polymyxa]|nr:chemotaxis protein CheY [Paenibacillus polymyxa]